jgi:hypothetical protein
VDLEALKAALKEHLTLKTETRCKGHMAPSETWLIATFDGEVVAEVLIASEEAES